MTTLSSTRDPARRLRGGSGGGRGSYRGRIGRGNYGGGNYNGVNHVGGNSAGVGYAGVGDVGGDYGGLDEDGLDYGGGDYEFIHEPEEPAMVPPAPAPAPAAVTSGRDRVHDSAAAASNHEHVLHAPEFDYEDAHDRATAQSYGYAQQTSEESSSHVSAMPLFVMLFAIAVFLSIAVQCVRGSRSRGTVAVARPQSPSKPSGSATAGTDLPVAVVVMNHAPVVVAVAPDPAPPPSAPPETCCGGGCDGGGGDACG